MDWDYFKNLLYYNMYVCACVYSGVYYQAIAKMQTVGNQETSICPYDFIFELLYYN